ncbi:hypothetical protein [Pseudonocardia spinosispora]|uniref:hypothetical protein n=1 Tax=Pseudonocardia spinosispora TaxID=103441 RepID=UPI000400BA81|nr:hypothetical protein [Pseudonocardia spinosispora]
MQLVPQHRALFAVDVVSAASRPGYHLRSIPRAVGRMLDEALAYVGIDPTVQILTREHTGDGAVLTLPSRYLGAVLEAAHALDEIARDRNRRRKPEIRLRMAVEVGPVGDAPGLYRPKIALARLLEAAAFKELFARCLAERPDSVNSGLIISGRVREDVFGGNYTRRVRAEAFTELPIRNKEFTSTAWARIPDFDVASLSRLALPGPPPAHAVQPIPPPEPEDTIGPPGDQVLNHVAGNMSGIQAGVVYGGLTFSPGS